MRDWLLEEKSTKYLTGVGKALRRVFENRPGDLGRVVEVRIKVDAGGVFIVTKAVTSEGPKVCFTQSDSPLAAVRLLGAGRRDGKLAWRDDKPWQPKVAQDDDGW